MPQNCPNPSCFHPWLNGILFAHESMVSQFFICFGYETSKLVCDQFIRFSQTTCYFVKCEIEPIKLGGRHQTAAVLNLCLFTQNYQLNNKNTQRMNNWNICDADLTAIGLESSNEIITTPFPFAHLVKPQPTSAAKIYKPKRKGSEKTSLRKLSSHKPECQTNKQYPQSKTSQHSKLQLRFAANHVSCFQPKKHLASPRIGLQKKEQRFQHNPIPSYRLSPSFERVPAAQKVKVNFIKPPFNPETSHPNQIRHYNEDKGIKRMNSTPQKVFSESFEESIHFGTKMQRLGLAKSMNDNKNVQLIVESKNLNEMRFIKAESLPDSQEDRDQFSIVLSPIQLDGENRNKIEGWSNYKTWDGMNEVSTPQTVEWEPLLDL